MQVKQSMTSWTNVIWAHGLFKFFFESTDLEIGYEKAIATQIKKQKQTCAWNHWMIYGFMIKTTETLQQYSDGMEW